MGCLRALFVQIGCLVALVAAAVFGFIYREQVVAVYRRLRGLPPPAVEVTWTPPGPGDADRAAATLGRLAGRGGPAYVDLTAGELAALIEAGLRRAPRRLVDSVAVGLAAGEILVRGVVDLTQVPPRLLGPLAGGLGRHEPVRIGGTLAADTAGAVWWTITVLQVRDFPFPRSTIPALLRALRVEAREAAVELPLPAPVGDARVDARRVRVYRR